MIARAIFETSGMCRIVDEDGAEGSRFQTVYEPAFNSQYPPPLSPDGAVLYVGTWERGLFCYDVRRGDVLWRQGPGKVRRIFPFESGLVAEMCNRGLYRRRQDTGELTGITKMSAIAIASRLSPGQLFAGPRRDRYYVYDLPALHPIAFVYRRDVNPGEFLQFSIREVTEDDGHLMVSGFEGSEFDRVPQRDFERRVRLRPA